MLEGNMQPRDWRRHWGGLHVQHDGENPDKWEGTLSVERRPLDEGGYDARGRYFGTPSTVYHVESTDETAWVDFFIRANDNMHAIEVARRAYPAAQIRFEFSSDAPSSSKRGHGLPAEADDGPLLGEFTPDVTGPLGPCE